MKPSDAKEVFFEKSGREESGAYRLIRSRPTCLLGKSRRGKGLGGTQGGALPAPGVRGSLRRHFAKKKTGGL